MVSPFVLAPLEDVLQRRVPHLPLGITVVIVAGYLTEGLRAQLVRGHTSSERWFMVWVGDEPAPALGPKIQVYDAGSHLRELERGWQAERGSRSPAGVWSEA
jgi:hypothetical protein